MHEPAHAAWLLAAALATCLAGVALTGIFAEPVLRWLDTFHTAL